MINRANWIDGYIYEWDNENQNWKRFAQNMFVILKSLNDPKNISSEFMDIIMINRLYGITQDPQTKNYMMILNYKYDKCEKCNGGFSKVYKANWIDGYIKHWDYKNQNWVREGQNIFVYLRSLSDPKNIILEFKNKINRPYGITQDPKTKYYMMVLSDECKICNQACEVIHFQQNFESWTSGNDDIDKFIQDTQLLAHDDAKKALEWIPYNRLYNIKHIEKIRMYRANWIDGYFYKWDNENQDWSRYGKNMIITLKVLNNYVTLEFMNKIKTNYEFYGITQDPQTLNYMMVVIDKSLKSLCYSKNITLEFMNEMIFHHKLDPNYRIINFYGITQDPETKNYVMVLEYADDGSLRKYLDTSYNKLNWQNKINHLFDIITGLKFIHESNLIHRDLHVGNILKLKFKIAITDMGLCKPANCNLQKNNVYGVLPYIAPEILLGRAYTKAADIYSFGIMMYEVISGLPPFHDVSHDENLAIKICQGLRPRFDINVPQLIVHLIKRCLDANSSKRPEVEDIRYILYMWRHEPDEKQTTELQAQIKKADAINDNSSNNSIPSTCLGLSYKTHSEAVYTSRLLNFNNLPEPKNSDDYYRYNDNIISIESSVLLSQQIDISQLDINNLLETKNSDDD
ncbi:kinase-like domain-containing protein [Rhizophagus irregularis DAOM 181602=DAOM 197198]|nr:kinase-like domain-containing protein [Rhizophagus irregularis DAOM 181602=DAOM 197198]